MTRRIWLLDDTEHWHAVTAATVERVGGWRFRGFQSSASLFAAMQEAGDAGPDILLMDFFLAGERGDQVTRALRSGGIAPQPLIVAHSTTSSGNAAILQAGADVHVPKTSVRGEVNPHLARWLAAHPGG